MMFITNEVRIAKIAESATVDIIFIDLEVNGKNVRQANMDTVKSSHTISDVSNMKNILSTSKLLVRINPLYEGTQLEIDEVISRGADIVMLPMFQTTADVVKFVDIVNGRAQTMLLVETIEAEKSISQISAMSGINTIHIGLNDLHIAHNKTFMFELLTDGNVERMRKHIMRYEISYGFGGIAKLDEGMLPARSIIAEHYRLGSTQTILSRSFCNTSDLFDYDEIEEQFENGMKAIREFECQLPLLSNEFFANNRNDVIERVKAIVYSKRGA